MNTPDIITEEDLRFVERLINNNTPGTLLHYCGARGKWLTTKLLLELGMCACPDCGSITNIESGEVMGVDIYCKHCGDYKLIISKK